MKPLSLSSKKDIMEKQRTISLDWMRFVACILVILQHVAEFYYVSPEFLPARTENTFLVGIFNSISRVSVPLFVMISGYLLLPMRQSTADFFKRRFTRILYPFLVWSVVYSIYFAILRHDSFMQWVQHVLCIPITYEAEHLWYIYMLIGLYVLIPVLSPWLKSVSRRELEAYLFLWIFTTLLPYVKLVFPTIGAAAFFNSSPTFYYFSGFVGYLLLGHYIRLYNPFTKVQAVSAIVIGWIVTSVIFLHQLAHCETLEELELSWGFCTLNVLLMCVGVFVLFIGIKKSTNSLIEKWVVSVSTFSYGIYLCHVLWLRLYMLLFMPMFGNVIWVALCVVPCTFLSSYLTIWILSHLPKTNYLY